MSRTKMMSRKLERVNIVTSSLLKVHLEYQKYLKENLKPFFHGSWRRWDKKDDYLGQAPGPWLSRSLGIGFYMCL